MLKKLACLTLETDGCYASNEQLQFLEDYLKSAEGRISTYEKIRDNEEKIIHHWEAAKREYKEDLFHMNSRDISEICNRDMTNNLRCAAASMLVEDLDKLRDGLIIWYRTIVRSFGYTPFTRRIYQIIQEVIKFYLSPEEVDLILPVLKLYHTILSV